ncbi:MAG: lysophospholipase, partial [Terrimicrobiaceae bacterium]|nr:lysophospholipase [Terrimicrobiaceae bacterium]
AWHGMGGAPSDFDSFGQRLARQGWHVAAPAVRGQGLDPDPRRRGTFLDPDAIARDIRAFSEEVLDGEDGPRIFAGESLGALLGAHALAAGAVCFDAVIFSAPVVGLSRPTPGWARLALRILARAVPHGRLRPSWFVTGGPNAPKTSRDEEWIAEQKRGPQHIPAFGFAALEAVGRLMDSVRAAAPHIQPPALVLAAGQDVFVTPAQIEHWFHSLGSKEKTLKIFPKAHHVLWNDWDREAVLDCISEWLEARHARRQTPSAVSSRLAR